MDVDLSSGRCEMPSKRSSSGSFSNAIKMVTQASSNFLTSSLSCFDFEQVVHANTCPLNAVDLEKGLDHESDLSARQHREIYSFHGYLQPFDFSLELEVHDLHEVFGNWGSDDVQILHRLCLVDLCQPLNSLSRTRRTSDHFTWTSCFQILQPCHGPLLKFKLLGFYPSQYGITFVKFNIREVRKNYSQFAHVQAQGFSWREQATVYSNFFHHAISTVSSLRDEIGSTVAAAKMRCPLFFDAGWFFRVPEWVSNKEPHARVANNYLLVMFSAPHIFHTATPKPLASQWICTGDPYRAEQFWTWKFENLGHLLNMSACKVTVDSSGARGS